MTIRMAQWGTRHGHAAGKAQAMRRNPDVELVGVFEPDPQARAHAEGQRAYAGLRFFDRAEDLLGEPGVVAVAIEGMNAHSLPMAREAVQAGKHIWYDKPAGDDWEAFQEVVAHRPAPEPGAADGVHAALPGRLPAPGRVEPRGAAGGRLRRAGPHVQLDPGPDRPARRLHPQRRRGPPRGHPVRPGRAHARPGAVGAAGRAPRTRDRVPAQRRHAGRAFAGRQHPGRAGVRAGPGHGGDRGDGAPPAGAPLRGLRHRGERHPGPAGAGERHPALPAGGQGGLRPPGCSGCPWRGSIAGAATSWSWEPSSPPSAASGPRTAASTTSCSSRRPSCAPPDASPTLPECPPSGGPGLRPGPRDTGGWESVSGASRRAQAPSPASPRVRGPRKK